MDGGLSCDNSLEQRRFHWFEAHRRGIQYDAECCKLRGADLPVGVCDRPGRAIDCLASGAVHLDVASGGRNITLVRSRIHRHRRHLADVWNCPSTGAYCAFVLSVDAFRRGNNLRRCSIRNDLIEVMAPNIWSAVASKARPAATPSHWPMLVPMPLS